MVEEEGEARLRDFYTRSGDGRLQRICAWDRLQFRRPPVTKDSFLEKLAPGPSWDRECGPQGECMKTTSWDALGLDRRRTAALVAASAPRLLRHGRAPGLPVPRAARPSSCRRWSDWRPAYTVAAAPRRSLELSALAQARESPALAASAAVYLQSTGSRCKTILMLDSGENRLSSLLDEMKKKTLLGLDLGQGLDASDLLVESAPCVGYFVP